MRLRIRHRTTYGFDRPVFVEPHVIRLRPRGDAAQWPHSLALQIDPVPAARAENLDAEGNAVTQAWFAGMTEHLRIESQSTVDTLRTDPFSFLLDDPSGMLPCRYRPALQHQLAASLGTDAPVHAAVRDIARAASEEAGHRPDRFPIALTTRIHDRFQVEYREDGDPRLPEATAALGSGACRDLAVLFMACCRSVGLAARFVSGYAYVDGSTDAELHAWAEVYIAGGGWRAYDPTLGLVVADLHVAVAAAAEPADAAPVSGSYRGSAISTLETVVEVSADTSAA